MRNGTQEELDIAKNDATLLPFDAKFKTNGFDNPFNPGEIVCRKSPSLFEDTGSVRFMLIDGSDFWYLESSDLEPIA
jgi:hypothetical protein